mmetsp:Transcript_88148/g.278820  ORF Transcript_88148/g.278820 Transcript_88148/m.278820 type:complete len:248 (-) Transcript_88148:355-1098(-)
MYVGVGSARCRSPRPSREPRHAAAGAGVLIESASPDPDPVGAALCAAGLVPQLLVLPLQPLDHLLRCRQLRLYAALRCHIHQGPGLGAAGGRHEEWLPPTPAFEVLARREGSTHRGRKIQNAAGAPHLHHGQADPHGPAARHRQVAGVGGLLHHRRSEQLHGHTRGRHGRARWLFELRQAGRKPAPPGPQLVQARANLQCQPCHHQLHGFRLQIAAGNRATSPPLRELQGRRVVVGKPCNKAGVCIP